MAAQLVCVLGRRLSRGTESMARRRGSSFATRLLLGGLAVVVVIVVVLTAFLLVSRERETRTAALSNATQRSDVLGSLIEHETAVTGQGVVDQLAAQPALIAALAGPAPGTEVPRLFSSPQTATPAGHRLVILDAAGRVAFSTLSPTLPVPTLALPSVRKALAVEPKTGVASIERLGGDQSVIGVDVALPVRTADGVPVGVLIDVAPLADQLKLFAPAIGDRDNTVVLIPATQTQVLDRVDGPGQVGAASVPADLATALRGGGTSISLVYAAPNGHGATEDVAASFVPVADASGAVTGFIGVETPVSLFTGDLRQDEVSVLLIAVFLLLGTAVVVLLFVDRFVRRPVGRLERGVARIAGGDYSSDIPMTRHDELGRLASAVNRMRAEIQGDIAEIERGRARLDAAVERLGGVSRALTTTASGIPALQEAVVRAAVAISGEETAAVLLVREGDTLVPVASDGVAGFPGLEDWGVVAALREGRPVRAARAPAGWNAGGMLAVPMFYQERVTGALAVFSAPGTTPAEGDEATLAVLANNAAIALENTRLFEMERETVRRLRELDAMKSDFLATVQHELRTPLTAIMGMTDLLEMCWDGWSDEHKLEAITDVQVATRNLHEIVETIIDFSLVERDVLGLHAGLTPLLPEVQVAVDDVDSRLKGKAAPRVVIDIPSGVTAYADPERLRQVLRHLVDNALKFSPDGTPVHIRASADGDWVTIDVMDQGIGIPAEAIPHVFERFYQVDNTSTRSYGGTGMGLALVRRLVSAHGASVEVASTEGAGTCFRLRWPATARSAGGELTPGALEPPRGVAV